MFETARPFATLAEYREARDALFARVVAALKADSRVVAAWLSGSFGRNEDDEWADYDLHVAVEDKDYQPFLDERPGLYMRVGTPILIQADVESDSLSGGRFQLVLFRGAIEVDWNIGARSQAVRPLAHRMLIERADLPVVAPPAMSEDQRRVHADNALTFFWAMAPIAIKYAGRTDTRRAVTQIELLSGAFISLSRLATQPSGPDPRLHATNRILEDEIDAKLHRVGSAIDPMSALEVIGRLCEEVELLHSQLAGIGVVVPAAMPDEVRAFLSLGRVVVAEGNQHRRKYR